MKMKSTTNRDNVSVNGVPTSIENYAKSTITLGLIAQIGINVFLGLLHMGTLLRDLYVSVKITKQF